MTEKKATTPRKKRNTTKKPVKQVIEKKVIDERPDVEIDDGPGIEVDNTDPVVTTAPVQEKFEENESEVQEKQDVPDETTTEDISDQSPIMTMTEVLPKEFTINFKKITEVKDVVLLLRGMGLKNFKIFETDIDDHVKELIAKKYIKEV